MLLNGVLERHKHAQLREGSIGQPNRVTRMWSKPAKRDGLKTRNLVSLGPGMTLTGKSPAEALSLAKTPQPLEQKPNSASKRANTTLTPPNETHKRQFLTWDCVPIVVEDVGATKKTVVASVYFAGDEACPPPEITALAEYCKRTHSPSIIGCDANAHHVIWGSSDVNQREFLTWDCVPIVVEDVRAAKKTVVASV
ncbi:GM10073 [Drosophila sechellia]|uniref:GM10073 n=1 Tax=Drosophila sechellia TaxID=7238 RepID=B4ILR8_DROSE|nr:GM10073 [Drosophila sechellia]